VDIETAREAGLIEREDREHWAHAAAQGRVLYSFNRGDFCRLHAEFLATGKDHAGMVLSRQQQYGIGEQMRRLLKLIAATTAEQMHNRHAQRVRAAGDDLPAAIGHFMIPSAATQCASLHPLFLAGIAGILSASCVGALTILAFDPSGPLRADALKGEGEGESSSSVLAPLACHRIVGVHWASAG
jgi:Domain of unknown function (DUF5615)